MDEIGSAFERIAGDDSAPESDCADQQNPFENNADDDLAPDLYSFDRLGDEFNKGLQKIEGLFDDDHDSIAETLEKDDVQWQIAWGTMCDDELCAQRLLNSVISPLRSALATLRDHRSEDPDAERDASIQKVRASIKAIRILNINDSQLCECTLEDSVLTLTPCLRPTMDNPAAATTGFTADQIEWSIRDALDLDVGPAIERTKAAVADFVADCGKDIGFRPQVTVDWESFRTIGGGSKPLDALKRLRDDMFSSVHYALFHLKKKVPFDRCLKTLHFKNVETIDERSVTADGTSITFSVPLIESTTCYTTEGVQNELARAVKELPHDPAGETAPPADEFQQMVTSMETDMMGPMRTQMSQLYGKDFGLEVDWESMDHEPDHFYLVVSGVMGTVMGALMVLAYDHPKKETAIAAVDGMALRYDHSLRGVAISLDGGILKVSCGGPASQYKADPAAMGELITSLLP